MHATRRDDNRDRSLLTPLALMLVFGGDAGQRRTKR
jgi:hypothetical protein